MNMIDFLMIVMGWLAIMAINGAPRDHETRLKRLERKPDTSKMQTETNEKKVKIEES